MEDRLNGKGTWFRIRKGERFELQERKGGGEV